MEERLPNCFGEHEAGHADCSDCQVEEDCQIQREAAAQQAATRGRYTRPPPAPTRPSYGNRTSTQTSTLARTSPPAVQGIPQVVEEDHDQGFFHALAYNGVLQAVTAMFGEAYRSLTEVPRLSYRSVWRRPRRPPPDEGTRR